MSDIIADSFQALHTYLLTSFRSFPEIATQPTQKEFAILAIFCLSFWTLTHLLLEGLFMCFNKTWQGYKEREKQIEYREYVASCIHAFIVVPMAFYGMFNVW